MPSLGRPVTVTAAVALVAAAAAPLAASQGEPSTAVRPAPGAVVTRPSRMDRLVAAARRRYGEEVHGVAVHAKLRRIAQDATLRRTLRSGNAASVQAYVRRQFNGPWYHQHVSRVRIVQGSRVVADAGVPFVVAPSRRVMRGPNGRSLGTLEVSIQDVVGYVKYMRRNLGIDSVVRGTGAGHVKASIPGTETMQLPQRGTATIAGRRYLVRMFHTKGFGGEPLSVWVLARG